MVSAIPQAPVTPRQALQLIVAVSALAGISAGYAMAANRAESLLLVMASGVLFSFFTFLWYCRDRDLRGAGQSRWLSIFMVSMIVLALPYYLWRSRPQGQKLRSFFRMLGFVALCLVVEIAGVFLGVLLPA